MAKVNEVPEHVREAQKVVDQIWRAARDVERNWMLQYREQPMLRVLVHPSVWQTLALLIAHPAVIHGTVHWMDPLNPNEMAICFGQLKVWSCQAAAPRDGWRIIVLNGGAEAVVQGEQ